MISVSLPDNAIERGGCVLSLPREIYREPYNGKRMWSCAVYDGVGSGPEAFFEYLAEDDGTFEWLPIVGENYTKDGKWIYRG